MCRKSPSWLPSHTQLPRDMNRRKCEWWWRMSKRVWSHVTLVSPLPAAPFTGIPRLALSPQDSSLLHDRQFAARDLAIPGISSSSSSSLSLLRHRLSAIHIAGIHICVSLLRFPSLLSTHAFTGQAFSAAFRNTPLQIIRLHP
jgi:hypothetical protein